MKEFVELNDTLYFLNPKLHSTNHVVVLNFEVLQFP